MKRSSLVSFVACLFLLAALPLATFGSSQKRSSSRSTTRPAAKTTELYAVVQIGDEYRVIRKSEVANEKKRVAEKYKDDMKSYQESKGKKKDPPVEKPQNLKVLVLKSTFKSQQDAQEYCDKMKEKGEAAGAKQAAETF